MRKVDYQTLAQSFALEKRRVMHAWFDDEKERARHVDTLRRVASLFASSAAVDKDAFMRACDLS